MNLANKNILILGLGESGLSVARWCVRQNARATVLDTRTAPPYLAALRECAPEARFISGSMAEGFDKNLLRGIDLVALSPGLSGGLMAVIHARAQGIPVVGEIELFAWGLAALGWRKTGAGHARVLAITGTNGKTTTTALTGHLCRAAGLTTAVAGNISPAALSALMSCQDAGKPPAVWVLELSSFQLETLDSLDADAAAVLNISDDHLDRYIDIQDYATAKARIFKGNSGAQILNRDDRRVRALALPQRRMISFGLDAPGLIDDFGLRQRQGEDWLAQGDRLLMPLADLPLAGRHNAANALAALALCAAIDLSPGKLLPALRSFKGLPHRVEKIAQIDGVEWYDDSKGTNVGATVAAIDGLTTARRKLVVILGGEGKGQDFTPLAQALGKTRAAILIGRDAPLIAAAVNGATPCLSVGSMEEAVKLAAQTAQDGDAVLLSPACASFDMFRDYQHRAQVFAAAVAQLIA